METVGKLEDGSKFRTRTAKLRSELERSDGVESAVAGVLKSFHDNNIDLLLFLDYISYSDYPSVKTSNLSNAVHAARIALLYSAELPGKLNQCCSRPTQHGKGISSDTPGCRTMLVSAPDALAAPIGDLAQFAGRTTSSMASARIQEVLLLRLDSRLGRSASCLPYASALIHDIISHICNIHK
jgi:hypothetical protein